MCLGTNWAWDWKWYSQRWQSFGPIWLFLHHQHSIVTSSSSAPTTDRQHYRSRWFQLDHSSDFVMEKGDVRFQTAWKEFADVTSDPLWLGRCPWNPKSSEPVDRMMAMTTESALTESVGRILWHCLFLITVMTRKTDGPRLLFSGWRKPPTSWASVLSSAKSKNSITSSTTKSTRKTNILSRYDTLTWCQQWSLLALVNLCKNSL